MRVACVVPVFPQLSETFVIAKAVGLLDRGVDVHIVCDRSDDSMWERFAPDHPVHRLRGRVHVLFPLRPVRTMPSAVAATVSDLARGDRRAVARTARSGRLRGPIRHMYLDAPLIGLRPDVVHFEFGALAVGREDIGRRLDCALTVSFRGSDISYIGLEDPAFYDRLWSAVDGVHVLGRAMWARAHRRGAPAGMTPAEIPPAVDVDRIQAAPPRAGALGGEQPVRVLSVGRMHWTKAYDDALDAIAILRRRGLQVEHRIIGGGELLGAVAFWRHQLGLDDSVHLLGPLAPSDVAEHFQWADVLLHSAISEGFCNVVVEAQAHGVPVVCTDAGGLPDNVEHQITGVVVPRRDATALADGLARLAYDAALRSRMGAAGRRRVEQHFRLDDQIDAWVRFYEQALTRRTSVGVG